VAHKGLNIQLNIGAVNFFGILLHVQNGSAVTPTLSVKLCIQSGSVPSSNNAEMVCASPTDGYIMSAEFMSLTKYFLYPRPGPWFIGFQPNCSNKSVGYASVCIFVYRNRL